MSHAANGTLPETRHAKRVLPVSARRAPLPQPYAKPKAKAKPQPRQDALKSCEWRLLKALFPDNLDLIVTDTEFRRALGLLAGRVPADSETLHIVPSRPRLHLRFATLLTSLLAAPAWPALRTELRFVAETRLAFKEQAAAGGQPLRSQCAVCVRLAALKRKSAQTDAVRP